MAEPIFQPPPNYREEPPFKYLSTLKAGEMWIQSLNKDGIRAPAKEENRIFLNPTSSKDAELSLCYAAVSIMERDLGGHADRFDPFQIAVFYAPLGELKFVCGGTVHVGEGGHHIDENDEPCDAFGYVNFKFPTTRLGVGFPVPNLFPKTPLTVSTPFEWSTINDNQFERLIFAMYDDDANFKNVEWLQHVNAPDAGRDISATRAENDSRILIQARHVKKSISEVDANEVVTKAETWDLHLMKL